MFDPHGRGRGSMCGHGAEGRGRWGVRACRPPLLYMDLATQVYWELSIRRKRGPLHQLPIQFVSLHKHTPAFSGTHYKGEKKSLKGMNASKVAEVEFVFVFCYYIEVVQRDSDHWCPGTRVRVNLLLLQSLWSDRMNE